MLVFGQEYTRRMRRKPCPKHQTATLFLVVGASFFACAAPLAGRRGARSSAKLAQSTEAPFSVAIVPGEGGVLTMGRNAREFYVVLTNVSNKPQNTWEYWNSLGYQTLSFEITALNGRSLWSLVRLWTSLATLPSTFAIPPGEHEVFIIRFGRNWQEVPAIPNRVQMPLRSRRSTMYHRRKRLSSTMFGPAASNPMTIILCCISGDCGNSEAHEV
jgi:hypothetical protein